MKSISAVLFDADGVIQEPTPEWLDYWKRMLRSDQDPDEFISEIFQAELPHLTGKDGFEDSVHQVMDRWEIKHSLDDVLSVWTLINPSVPIIDIVSAIRRRGLNVALATTNSNIGIATWSQVFVITRFLITFLYPVSSALPNLRPNISQKSPPNWIDRRLSCCSSTTTIPM